jgi:DNA-binding MarR family transcriptional regulator
MKSSQAPDLDPSPLPALGEILEFMRLIWEVDHALQRTSKRMETTLGVTGRQRLVIRIAGRFPGIPAGQLAKLMHVHPSTLTGILKRLERQGLTRRRADPRDGRRFLLSLTNKGRVFDVATEGTIEFAIRQVLEHAQSDRVQAAREVLASIAQVLGNWSPREEPAQGSSKADSRKAGSPRGRASHRPRGKSCLNPP